MDLLKLLEDSIPDGDKIMDLGDGAIISVVAIVGVFLILLIIIGLTSLIFKLTGLFEMKKQLDAAKKSGSTLVDNAPTSPKSVNISDDDMMAAVLVATIDYQQEIKKDVRVVNVTEIK